MQYAWRYDPCELVQQGATRPAPQQPRVDVCEEEEEDWACEEDMDVDSGDEESDDRGSAWLHRF